jgi:hypothetical protein
MTGKSWKQVLAKLWKVANLPSSDTLGKINVQQSAFRALLNLPGGADFVVCKPPEELDELRRRGIWAGIIILRELAGLELKRRQLLVDVADIDQQRRQILSDPTRIPPCRCGLTHLSEETPHQTR